MTSFKDKYKIFPDFPKSGVSFLDISPILADAELRYQLKDNIRFELDSNFKRIDSELIDKVIAIESRGFLFGDTIADSLGSGLVLARKPNKLPGELISENYGTEYSNDKLEMQLRSIVKGDKVVIHDDVLATGGTVLAVKRMVERMGGEVIGYVFIAEISALNGRDVLGDTIVSSIVEF